jgi:hypothetical protein
MKEEREGRYKALDKRIQKIRKGKRRNINR